jgi:hypothetical protein
MTWQSARINQGSEELSVITGFYFLLNAISIMTRKFRGFALV